MAWDLINHWDFTCQGINTDSPFICFSPEVTALCVVDTTGSDFEKRIREANVF